MTEPNFVKLSLNGSRENIDLCRDAEKYGQRQSGSRTGRVGRSKRHGVESVQRLDIGKGGKRDQYRAKKPGKLGRWRSADVRYYSTNPADAYLIGPRMKELGLWERYAKELLNLTRAKGLPVDWATPDQSCRAALKALKARR